jgi:predicted dinucleotide-binding enzyme
MKIVVIGGTGLIGSKTVAILREGANEVVAASPKCGVNTVTGEGLKETIVGAQVAPLPAARCVLPDIIRRIRKHPQPEIR